MRMVFGVLGLLVVLAVVGVLAKKQLTAVAPGLQAAPGASAAASPAVQVQRVQQAVQDAMQQPRPMPDDK